MKAIKIDDYTPTGPAFPPVDHYTTHRFECTLTVSQFNEACQNFRELTNDSTFTFRDVSDSGYMSTMITCIGEVDLECNTYYDHFLEMLSYESFRAQCLKENERLEKRVLSSPFLLKTSVGEPPKSKKKSKKKCKPKKS